MTGPYPLTPRHWALLYALYDLQTAGERPTAAEIVEQTACHEYEPDLPSITLRSAIRMTEGLTNHGLIRRLPVKDSSTYALTDEGREMVDQRRSQAVTS